ncbi:MAG: enoyl-CoA hydratase/isomerase family protein [Acidimicrobiales bacterium]
MSAYEEESPPVLVERTDGNVALVTLNKPKANALSSSVLEHLASIVAGLREDPPGAVVLYGGTRLFSAGADITEMDLDDPEAPARIAGNFHEVTNALATMGRMVIAAITGFALGGGLELALACDMRLAGESAKMGLPEIGLGILPGGGGTQRLPRLIGSSRAKEMVLSGRHVGAREALEIGLVNKIVPDGEVLDAAMSMAREFARGPLAAQALAKQAIDRGIASTLQEGLALECQAFGAVFATDDARTGISSFLAHGPGKAEFVGH